MWNFQTIIVVITLLIVAGGMDKIVNKLSKIEDKIDDISKKMY